MADDNPVPVQCMMAQHLEWLVDDLQSAERFELAWGPPDVGPTNARTFALDDLDAAVSQAFQANCAGNNVYLGATLKRYGTPPFGRTKNEHADLATCMFLDFDTDILAGTSRLESMARAAVLVVTGTKPQARAQLAVRLTPTQDLTRLDELTRRFARECRADICAVGINRLMRLAGTVSFPSGAKRARGYKTELTSLRQRSEISYSLDDLEQLLPPLTLPPPAQRITSTHPPRSVPVNVVNVRIINSALHALPEHYSDEYPLWLQVGFALHDFHPGAVGLALWRRFSERCSNKAALTDFERLWVKFGASFGAPKVTLGSLIHHAKQVGWRQPRRWDRLSRLS